MFAWRSAVFEQRPDVFKIGTDALLLGAWSPEKLTGIRRILDVGTGTGFLAVAMGLTFPEAHLDAVDIQAPSLALAAENLRRNGMWDRARVFMLDILDPAADIAQQYDLVISNPPYFERSWPSRDTHEAMARHLAGGADTWIRGCLHRLHPDGHLRLVIPAQQAGHWIRLANERGWYVGHRLDVRIFAGDPAPFRTLLHMTRQLKKPTLEHLTLYREKEVWHPEFLRWRQAYESP